MINLKEAYLFVFKNIWILITIEKGLAIQNDLNLNFTFISGLSREEKNEDENTDTASYSQVALKWLQLTPSDSKWLRVTPSDLRTEIESVIYSTKKSFQVTIFLLEWLISEYKCGLVRTQSAAVSDNISGRNKCRPWVCTATLETATPAPAQTETHSHQTMVSLKSGFLKRYHTDPTNTWQRIRMFLTL